MEIIVNQCKIEDGKSYEQICPKAGKNKNQKGSQKGHENIPDMEPKWGQDLGWAGGARIELKL